MVLKSSDRWNIVHYYLMFNKVYTLKIIHVFIMKDMCVFENYRVD
jgi:hypothetical protein